MNIIISLLEPYDKPVNQGEDQIKVRKERQGGGI